jgi:hypothetical protein
MGRKSEFPCLNIAHIEATTEYEVDFMSDWFLANETQEGFRMHCSECIKNNEPGYRDHFRPAEVFLERRRKYVLNIKARG